MSNYDIAELIWENGQLAMQGLGGMFSPPTSAAGRTPAKLTWGGGGRAGDTLESIVHQATYCSKQSPSSILSKAQEQAAGPNMNKMSSIVASSGGNKRAEDSGPPSGLVKKRAREGNDHGSACAGGDRGDNDTNMMTWASHEESPMSCTRTKSKTTNDEDSACHGGSLVQENQEEGRETKSETERSYTTRKGRAAAVHNQSERRRRDRINQKMKALQKLVPNASKTDKASMLDEVIDYLKQLQAQVQMMSNARLMPQIMMPIGIQQNLQMSLLARMGLGLGMGMGMGMGMLDTSSLAPTPTPTTVIPHLIHPTPASGIVPPGAFVVPHMVGTQQLGPTTSGSLQDPYTTLLAQTMNIELYNRMAALQRQQQLPQQMTAQPTNTQMQLNHQHAQ